MPRPLKPTHELRDRFDLYLDQNEMEHIRTRAKASSMAMSTFVRRAAMGQRIAARPSDVALERWKELARVSVNLNQIARACNAGELPTYVGQVLTAVSEEVRLLRLELLHANPSSSRGGS